MMQNLWWLPKIEDWAGRLSSATTAAELMALAKCQLDFVQTLKLDRKLQRLDADALAGLKTVKLAILASTTVDHLLSGLRVAGLRRGLLVEVYVGDFGQYNQELVNPASELFKFHPDVVLFSFDVAHLVGLELPEDATVAAQRIDESIARIKQVWSLAARAFSAQIIQQTLLPTPEPLMGGNESRHGTSPLRMVNELNHRLHAEAAHERVDILPLEHWAHRYGIDALHDPALWHRAKQEISPAATPLYGDLVLRLIGARRGLSAKCLVLDLDNTLWGGVIGDDGLDGIVLGQGSASGESFSHFQRYAKALTQRGVILAVCSKNDSDNAMAAFLRHPEMVLRTGDIAAFRINWQDKATNLREIAAELNIGLDALIFADDNPFERNIVRTELPMVMVPELPEDPALYARCIAESGYLEAVDVTSEDAQRVKLYAVRREETAERAQATDLEGYLKSLDMKLHWGPFQAVDLQRVTQLANKTNQFNLRTQRYTDTQIQGFMDRDDVVTLQLRLVDRFADHGIISLLIAPLDEHKCLNVETWLMSCRVLGRGVEEAVANVLFSEARRLGADAIKGEFIKTAKNQMVEDLYSKLGFVNETTGPDGASWIKRVADHDTLPTHITEVRLI